jgi:hypothetical protein
MHANKKFLIITTSFAPENAIGAIRLTKLAKYLTKKGHVVTVISPEVTPAMKIDTTLNSEEIQSIRKITVAHSPYFKKTLLQKRNNVLGKESAANLLSTKKSDTPLQKIKIYFLEIGHFIYTLIRNWDWQHNAVKAFNSHLAEEKFDFIISSYPSIGAMWAAKKLKQKQVSPVWLADFRDPINYYSKNTLTFALNTLFQKKLENHATYMSLISQDIARNFSKKNKIKQSIIYNGFDPDDLPSPPVFIEKDKKLSFSYTGSLHGGKRNLGFFFELIKELSDNQTISSKNIQLHYAGNDFHVLQTQADKYKLNTCLINHGQLNRKASLELQQKTDIGLVATWNTTEDQGILTGKLFECFLTQKPIFGIVTGNKSNSEFKRIITEVDGGVVYEEADINSKEECRRSLIKQYEEKLSSGQLASPYNHKRLNFSYENIVKKLEEVLFSQSQES